MLPTSLLALAASFILPVLAAPSCTPSSNDYAAQKMPYLFNDFCAGLTASNFGTKQKFYDIPVVALYFTPATVADCSLKECLTSLSSLVDSCDKDDGSIWGMGSVASSCGTYSFEIKDTSVTASLGAPDATIIAATIQTYNIATLTSTSTTTTTSSSSSSFSTTSSTTSSTSSLSSSQASTTSSTHFQTTYAPSTYTNTTTSTAPSNSSIPHQSNSPTVIPSTSLSAQASPTATMPAMGTATPGTSGASVLSVSGASLVLVAGVFAGFL